MKVSVKVKKRGEIQECVLPAEAATIFFQVSRQWNIPAKVKGRDNLPGPALTVEKALDLLNKAADHWPKNKRLMQRILKLQNDIVSM